MAVDVKVVRVYLWRCSVLFAGICFRFAQKHPCISGVFFSFFFLYVFFPFVFRLLIYSSPVIIAAYAYRKNVTKPEHPEARVQKKHYQTNDVKNELDLDIAKKRNVNFVSRQNGSVDAEEKERELKNVLRQSESDVLGKAVSDSKNSKALGKTENVKIDDDNWGKQNGESESDIMDRAEYEDDEETQEEDAQEDMQKALEWTEQDERNLMDLGTSEAERDKRLESLIQKRRARKLLSMQVRNVIDIIRHPPNQVAPLVIARSKGPLNLINTLSDTDVLHMPGSAPSVLLPSRSPFDLPYDPFEERPDLTGDSSFEQEFVTSDHKDLCRHESFLYGGHSGTRQDGNSLNSFVNAETKTERKRDSRFRSSKDRGSYETLSPEASSAEYELMTSADMVAPDSGCKKKSSEQPLETDIVTSKEDIECDNSKTENNEKCDSESLNADCGIRPGNKGNVGPASLHFGTEVSANQVENSKADSDRNLSSEDLSNFLHKSLASVQETTAKEAKENRHARAPLYTSSKDLFNVHKRVLHTPAHSIASDLVVEVSEAGSPPQTLSPPDEDSSHYDGDVERDLSSGSEDMSLHVYRMEDQGTRSLEGQESIPEVVELEDEVADEYEHTSPTSSDDNSSYENVVHHLTEKLNARNVSNNVIMDTLEEQCNPAEIGSGVQIENILSHQTNPMSGVSESVEGNEHNSTTTDQHETSELDGDSSKQENRSIEEGSNLDEQGSNNGEIAEAEDIHRNTEVRTSDDVTLGTEQQAQEVPEVTSPKTALPNSDFGDQTTRLDSQPSDLANSVSDVTLLENSTSGTTDIQTSQHLENARSSNSESNSPQRTKDGGLDQVTESEAALNKSISEDSSESSLIHKPDEAARDMGVNLVITDEKSIAAASANEAVVVNETQVSERKEETVAKTTEVAEGNLLELQGDNFITKVDPVDETIYLELAKDEKGTVSMSNQAESLEGESSAEALPLSNILNSDDEFNGMTEESHDHDLKGGSSTAEASKQNVYTDLTTLGVALTTSTSSIGTPGGNLDDTSVKSTNPPSKLDSQSEAPLPDMDTELNIHRITETCM